MEPEMLCLQDDYPLWKLRTRYVDSGSQHIIAVYIAVHQHTGERLASLSISGLRVELQEAESRRGN